MEERTCLRCDTPWPYITSQLCDNCLRELMDKELLKSVENMQIVEDGEERERYHVVRTEGSGEFWIVDWKTRTVIAEGRDGLHKGGREISKELLNEFVKMANQGSRFVSAWNLYVNMNMPRFEADTEGDWGVHTRDDENCKECTHGYPVRCSCGGLRHANWHDDGAGGTRLMAIMCDNPKCLYRDIEI